jgi:DNA replication protein DnaC
MNRPVKHFSARYANLTLPTEGPWYQAAGKANSVLKTGGIVCLFGRRGTGKTFMAFDLASNGVFPNDQEKDGSPRPAIYRTAMEIFLLIRDSWRKDARSSELDLMDEWRDAALLVIDEIQERGETSFENQKLTAIIDSRYRQGRPTLLIGNYETKGELAASLGSSIVSRLTENGGTIHCDWQSFRISK